MHCKQLPPLLGVRAQGSGFGVRGGSVVMRVVEAEGGFVEKGYRAVFYFFILFSRVAAVQTTDGSTATDAEVAHHL